MRLIAFFLMSFLCVYGYSQAEIESITSSDGNNSVCYLGTKIYTININNPGIEDIQINISNTTNFSFSINNPEVMESTMSVEFTAIDQGNGDATESFNVELAVIESPNGDTYSVEDVVHFGEIIPIIDFTGVSFCANGLPFDLAEFGSPLGGVWNWGLEEHTSYFDPVVCNDIFNGDEGTIGYTYTNNDGCSGSTGFSVMMLPPPAVTVQTLPTNCGQATGEAIASLPVGTLVDVYWSTGKSEIVSDESSIDNLSSGTYYINVTGPDGCKSVGTAHVSDADLTVTEVISSESCPGDNDGLIDLTVVMPAGSSSMTTFWSNGLTTEDMTGHEGEYSVEMHTDNNCNYYGVYEIPNTKFVFGLSMNDPENCSGTSTGIVEASVTGGNGILTYNWSNTAGMNIDSEDFDPPSGGVYTCTVTDTIGCSASWDHTVEVSGSSNVQVDLVNRANCGESNGSISVIDGTGDVSVWEWSNGETTQDLTNVAAGTYTLKHTNADGCEGYLTVNVPTIRPYQPQICLLTVDTSLVYNEIIWEKDPNNVVDGFNIYRETTNYGEFELVASLPYSHESAYIDNAASPVSRSWRYYITSYNDCEESYPSFIHKTIHITIESTNANDYNLAWDDYEGITYSSIDLKRYDPIADLWEVIANLTAGTNSYTDTPTGILNPEYLISFNLTDPCTSSKAQDHNASRSNNTSSVFVPGGDTDLSIIQNENGRIAIYPNPTHDNLNVFVENSDKFELIQIIDINGAIVYTQVINESYNIVNTSDMAAGIYFVQIYSNNEILTRKLIKH